jgi:hypothetical protein
VLFKPGENIYFLTYPPPTLKHLSHRFTSESKPAAQKSTIPPAAQLLLLQSQQGDLVGHHLRLSNALETIS